MATQVPYGESGTFPLTSVQTDRFAYCISMGYPEVDDEVKLLSKVDDIDELTLGPVMSAPQVNEIMEKTREIHVHERVKRYIVELITNVRNNPLISTGPSPRATIWLMKGGRARALMKGREYVIPDDVKYLARNVLQHRVSLTTSALAKEMSVKNIITETIDTVSVPKK